MKTIDELWNDADWIRKRIEDQNRYIDNLYKTNSRERTLELTESAMVVKDKLCARYKELTGVAYVYVLPLE